MVGFMSQTSDETTYSGAWSFWSTIIPNTGSWCSSAAAITPSRSANSTSAPPAIAASAACFAVAGSKKELMKETVTLASGLLSCAPAVNALTIRLTSGMGIAPTTPTVPVFVSPPAISPAR